MWLLLRVAPLGPLTPDFPSFAKASAHSAQSRKKLLSTKNSNCKHLFMSTYVSMQFLFISYFFGAVSCCAVTMLYLLVVSSYATLRSEHSFRSECCLCVTLTLDTLVMAYRTP